MSKNIYLILFLVVALFGGCDWLGSEKSELEIETQVEGEFRAVLNGKAWSGEPSAGVQTIEDGSRRLTFGGTWADGVFTHPGSPPYHEKITFSYPFEPQKTEYEVLIKSGENSRGSGGYYVKVAGDVVTAWYLPIPDSLNKLSFKIEKDADGRDFVNGSFSMKVADERSPDTIRITNGEFRALLTDWDTEND
ncbi:MAG: hypothetical protein WC967_03370 [Balneolaceae bacterium]